MIPFEGRYDADYGNIIMVDKGKGFRWVSPVAAGFLLRGEVRDIKAINTSNGMIYAVAFNNKTMRFFRLSK